MRLSRRTVVLAALLAGIVLLFTTTQTWVRAVGLGETSAVASVEIAGSDIAQGVTALALVVLAGAVAVTIARRLARLIIAVLMLGAAVVSGWSVIQVIRDPAEASLAALGEVTGTTETAGSYEIAPALWGALGAAVLLFIVSVVLLVGSSRWEETRRYESSRTGSTSVSTGSAAAAPGVASARAQGSGRAGAPGASAVDEFDLWDELSAGEDPTHDPEQDSAHDSAQEQDREQNPAQGSAQD